MFKKYYDENNSIIGVSCGEIKNSSVETDYEDFYRVANLLYNKPQKIGYEIALKEDGNDYDYEYNEIPASFLSDEELKEMFKDELLDSLTISDKPLTRADPKSLIPKLVGTSIVWEIVEEDTN